ncbi:MAG: hypothetical protein A2W31_06575 [Planctomycetes bacterium RBG_16_64_10]|nr:MAG: hypothetical protein A2W31_06575 [Planctomycetes bacterium RBG_16_64_10]
MKALRANVPELKTKHVRHDEIVLTKAPQFGPAWQFGGWTTNQVLVDAECRYYLENLDRDRGESQNARYPGLVKVELDGAISQVTYTLGSEGISTAVYRNDEDLRRVIPFGERRRMERDRDAAAVKQKIGELWDRLWNRLKG